MSPFVVRITDEFNSVYSLEAQTKSQVITTIANWLDTMDETPIYNIEIEINPPQE